MEWLDSARGIAIVLMIAYHVMFDLSYFGISAIDLYSLPLVLFQRFIGMLFLLIVGISLALSESKNNEGYIHHVKRALKLAGVALLITIATWVYPHDAFITFGIIHFIALATLLAPMFFGFGRTNVLLGLAIIGAGLLMNGIDVSQPYLFWLGLTTPAYSALDFYPLFPWFGIVLIGIYAGQSLFTKGESRISIRATKLDGALSFIGRNSLTIYLAHQPILVGLLLGIKALI